MKNSRFLFLLVLALSFPRLAWAFAGDFSAGSMQLNDLFQNSHIRVIDFLWDDQKIDQCMIKTDLSNPNGDRSSLLDFSVETPEQDLEGISLEADGHSIKKLGATLEYSYKHSGEGIQTTTRLLYIRGDDGILAPMGIYAEKRARSSRFALWESFKKTPFASIACHTPWHRNWATLHGLAQSLKREDVGDCEFRANVNMSDEETPLLGELRQAGEESVTFQLRLQSNQDYFYSQAIQTGGPIRFIEYQAQTKDRKSRYNVSIQVSIDENTPRYIHVERYDRKEDRGKTHKDWFGHGPWKGEPTWVRHCEAN